MTNRLNSPNPPDGVRLADPVFVNDRLYRADGTVYNIPGSSGAITATLFADGTLGAPGIAFTNDTDTGVYRISPNAVGIAAGGTLGLSQSATAIDSNLVHRFGDGAVGAPGITFINDTDTGIYRIGTNVLGFATQGVQRLRITDTGEVVVSSGQLQFPEPQVPSTNANTMDDYEEGSWTPVIGGSGGQSGQVYASQVGRFVKIGKMVWAQGYANLSNKGTITSNVEIQGLPFTSEDTVNVYAAATYSYWTLATNWILITGYANPNTTTIRVSGISAAGTGPPASLTTADIANNTDFMLSICYRATS